MARFNRFSDIRVNQLSNQEFRRRKSGGQFLVEGFIAKKFEWQEINNHTTYEAAEKERDRIKAKLVINE